MGSLSPPPALAAVERGPPAREERGHEGVLLVGLHGQGGGGPGRGAPNVGAPPAGGAEERGFCGGERRGRGGARDRAGAPPRRGGRDSEPVPAPLDDLAER